MEGCREREKKPCSAEAAEMDKWEELRMEANPTAFSVVGCSHRAQGWLPCQVESNRMAGRSSGQGRSEGVPLSSLGVGRPARAGRSLLTELNRYARITQTAPDDSPLSPLPADILLRIQPDDQFWMPCA